MQLIWYLLCYSFLGFCVEVLYARLSGASKRDRKCHLFLPLCPVYGVGGTAITALPEVVKGSLLLLFPAAVLVASGAEYGLSVFYQRVWGVSFWDYTGLPGNLQGRVCPVFSLLWGILGVILVRIIHPVVTGLTARLPDWLALTVLLLFLTDFALTTALLRRRRTTKALIWYR